MQWHEREKRKRSRDPVRHLQLELRELRRELRTTVRVYAQRLELTLTVTTDALDRYAPAEKLTREQLHRVRDIAMVVRDRRLAERGAAKICERSRTLFPICDHWSMMNNPLFMIAMVLIAVRQLSASAATEIIISIPDQTLAVVDSGKLIARYPVSTLQVRQRR